MDIIQSRKKYYIFSTIVILIGLLVMPLFALRGEGILNFDVEFIGGSVMQVDFKQEVDAEQDIMPMIEATIPDAGARIQKVENTTEMIITMKPVEDTSRRELMAAFTEKYSLEATDLKRDEYVSPSVSGEFRTSALIAVGVASVLMLLYVTIRFKDFKFGASAVVALIHDVLIMVGVYAVFRIPINYSFIAAMLTIVGYSINDTIIIFDRIRENKGRMHGDDKDVINTSLKQTMTRSINTSLTTVVMVLLLLVIGSDSVKEFAFPLVIGVLAGTYSSIFIASPLWYEMRAHAKKAA